MSSYYLLTMDAPDVLVNEEISQGWLVQTQNVGFLSVL